MIGLFPLIHFNSIHFNSMQCTAEQCSSMPFNSYESCGCHCSLRSYALMILILSLCLCVSASCVADSSAAATLVVCSHRECPAIVSRSLISRRIMLSHIQIATTKTARDIYSQSTILVLGRGSLACASSHEAYRNVLELRERRCQKQERYRERDIGIRKHKKRKHKTRRP